MRCWRVRRRLADAIDGSPAARPPGPLERHLAACPDCRAARLRLEAVAALVREAGRREGPTLDGEAFDTRLMAAIRARRAGRVSSSAVAPRWRPAPLAAAFALMAVAGLAGAYLSRPPAGNGARLQAPPIAERRPADPWTGAGRPGAAIDRAGAVLDLPDIEEALPAEILFSVRQDLVGERRGRIPLTAYVLEPAPREPAIVRASY